MAVCVPIAFSPVLSPSAAAILQGLSRGPVMAVLAGGYLRDQYFGATVKDLDVFVSSEFYPSMIQAVLPDVVLNPLSPDADGDYRGAESRGIRGVWDLVTTSNTPLTDLPIQVIAVDCYCLEDLFDTFDYGFCQIGMDLKNPARGTCVTPGFLKDAALDKATSTGPQPHHTDAHIAKRLKKLQERYPHRDFGVSIPDALDFSGLI